MLFCPVAQGLPKTALMVSVSANDVCGRILLELLHDLVCLDVLHGVPIVLRVDHIRRLGPQGDICGELSQVSAQQERPRQTTSEVRLLLKDFCDVFSVNPTQCC